MHRQALIVVLAVVVACGHPTQVGSDAPGNDVSDASPDASSAKQLVSLAFVASENLGLASDVAAAISGTNAIAVAPFGTNRSALVARFVTTGVRVEIAGVTQQSGVTANDFSGPVVYRVIAADGSTADYTALVAIPAQRAYVKASNTGADDYFGWSIALSGDANTLAVGAPDEASAATGIGGDQTNNSAIASGAVYVYTWSGTTWSQEAYVKASNTGANLEFGVSVALSADGNTLAVGARSEQAVYVFTRSGTTWSQQSRLTASNADPSDYFGISITLSVDGNTLAVGAYTEDSAATGIDGNQADNSARDSGAVYVYTRAGTTWSQQAYVKASNTGTNDYFGSSVALSGDGDTLAVGASGEASAATGVGGNQADNSAFLSGAVYVYVRSGTTWSQQAYVKASNANANDTFGASVALAADGNTLVVGAPGEASAATGINGSQSDNSQPSSGAVYVYSRSGTTWSQQAYVKASLSRGGNSLGYTVAVSGTGNILAVGAWGESSAATGIGGNQADTSVGNSGAVYVFARSGTTWSQQAYIKASNTGAGDVFGYSVAVSADGAALAVGARDEASAATGIDGNQADNSAANSGAGYVFH
jgi:hypothetical protein